MQATTDRAEFLKTAERFKPAQDSAVKTLWGEDALEVAQSSCLTTEAAALAEAQRQLAYTKEARASDRIVVEGLFWDLEGETVAIPYDGELGIAGTVNLLVTGCLPDIGTGQTTLVGEIAL